MNFKTTKNKTFDIYSITILNEIDLKELAKHLYLAGTGSPGYNNELFTYFINSLYEFFNTFPFSWKRKFSRTKSSSIVPPIIEVNEDSFRNYHSEMNFEEKNVEDNITKHLSEYADPDEISKFKTNYFY